MTRSRTAVTSPSYVTNAGCPEPPSAMRTNPAEGGTPDPRRRRTTKNAVVVMRASKRRPSIAPPTTAAVSFEDLAVEMAFVERTSELVSENIELLVATLIEGSFGVDELISDDDLVRMPIGVNGVVVAFSMTDPCIVGIHDPEQQQPETYLREG